MRLDGKVVIVTGAAAGIGAAIVRLFLDAGARVVAVDRDPIPADLGEAAEGRLECVAGDVGGEPAAEAYTGRALDAFGRIDVMINNAGLGGTASVLETTSPFAKDPKAWVK